MSDDEDDIRQWGAAGTDEDMNLRGLPPEKREELADAFEEILAFVEERKKMSAEDAEEEKIRGAANLRSDQIMVEDLARIIAKRRATAKGFASSLAISSDKRSLLEDLEDPDDEAEPRWWEMSADGTRVTGVLARTGQVIRIVGAPKSGKTTLMVDAVYSLLTGRPLLDTYPCKMLDEDQVVVILDLEQGPSDQPFLWGPYFGSPKLGFGVTVDKHSLRRVIRVSLNGIETDFLSKTIRDETKKLIDEKIAHAFPDRVMRIGAVVVDPLFATARGDFVNDPQFATDLWTQFFQGWLKDELKAETVIVLVHTAKSGGKFGGEMSSFGSVGWDSKFEALWGVRRTDIIDDDEIEAVALASEELAAGAGGAVPPGYGVSEAAALYERTKIKRRHLFIVEPGRARIGLDHAQYIVMDDSSGQLSIDTTLSDIAMGHSPGAAAAVHVSRKPKTTRSGATGRTGITKRGESPDGSGNPAKVVKTKELVEARLKHALTTGEALTAAQIRSELENRATSMMMKGEVVDFLPVKVINIVNALADEGVVKKTQLSGRGNPFSLEWTGEGAISAGPGTEPSA